MRLESLAAHVRTARRPVWTHAALCWLVRTVEALEMTPSAAAFKYPTWRDVVAPSLAARACVNMCATQ